mgnify:CR=1 FL=1
MLHLQTDVPVAAHGPEGVGIEGGQFNWQFRVQYHWVPGLQVFRLVESDDVLG